MLREPAGNRLIEDDVEGAEPVSGNHQDALDLKVRPIHNRLADRVRAHILLCMLAYYVEWHMREAWRELMFADTDQQAKVARDPVAPAKRPSAALA